MKAAASLTGSLLARKGAAYPASYSAPSSAPTESSSVSTDSRAYNDPRVIASAPPAPPAPPATEAPQMQDGRFVEDLTPVGSHSSVASDAAESVDSGGADLPQAMDKMGRVRLSVRLDPDRYLRVKMASARTRWSAQDIVIAALDRYLDGSAARSSGKAQPSGNGSDDGDVN